MSIEITCDPPTCCRKHWEAATDKHAYSAYGVLMKPLYRPFMACKACGNKRCPKATDCELPCTNSNEPGQPGSIYG